MKELPRESRNGRDQFYTIVSMYFILILSSYTVLDVNQCPCLTFAVIIVDYLSLSIQYLLAANPYFSQTNKTIAYESPFQLL